MLREETVGSYLDALSSGEPTPGGGTVAALNLAQAAALLSMVCNLTLGKEKYREIAPGIESVRNYSQVLRQAAETLADADALAFKGYMTAVALPKTTTLEQASRSQAMQSALQDAACVPLAVFVLGGHLLEGDGAIRLLASFGNPTVFSDVQVAHLMTVAAVQSAALNVRANTQSIKDLAIREQLEKVLTSSPAATAASIPLPEPGRPPDTVPVFPSSAAARVQKILESIPPHLLPPPKKA